MFKHQISEQSGFRTYVDWFLLAFLAGSVNAGGYISCHRFVSHVTGFATIAGLNAARGDWKETVEILTVPIYFLIGVMISAYLVDHRIYEGRRPRYVAVMGLVAALLLIAAVGGSLGWFGTFGAEPVLERDYFFLSLLCAASGLQNAALTSASGHTVRTTHLTGVTTDLGIGLIRAFSRRTDDPKRLHEVRANWLRMGTILSFMIGSASGALLYLQYRYWGFLLPVAIAVYATATAYYQSTKD